MHHYFVKEMQKVFPSQNLHVATDPNFPRVMLTAKTGTNHSYENKIARPFANHAYVILQECRGQVQMYYRLHLTHGWTRNNCNDVCEINPQLVEYQNRYRIQARKFLTLGFPAL